jgi:hypothetical protein
MDAGGLRRGDGLSWLPDDLDQGITGQIENAIDGLLLGVLYLACGRNLWVPIIAHGITDTADLMLLFLGKYPGI